MKRRFHYRAFIAVFLLLLLAACAPKRADSAVPAASQPTLAAAQVYAASPTPTISAIKTPAMTSSEPLPIRLQSGEFDPLVSEPALPQSLRLDAADSTSDYYIVQFDGPILEEWQNALDATGAERFDYVPEYAYLVRMSDAQKEAAAALPHVRWIGLFQPGYRIAPRLAAMTKESPADRRKLTVVTFPGIDMNAIKTKVTESGGVIEESSQNELSGKLRIEIDLNQVVTLARLPGVLWIEPWTAPTLQ